MTDWSRKALGSKNNLNHSHLMVPTIWLVFLASKPQAITCPLSLYNRQVGICGENQPRSDVLLQYLSECLHGARPIQNLLDTSASNARGTISLIEAELYH